MKVRFLLEVNVMLNILALGNTKRAIQRDSGIDPETSWITSSHTLLFGVFVTKEHSISSFTRQTCRYAEFQTAELDPISQNDYTCCVFVFLRSWVTLIALEFLSQADGHKRGSLTGWQVKSRKIYFISTAIKRTGKLCATHQKSITSYIHHTQTNRICDWRNLIYVCSYRLIVTSNSKDNRNRITARTWLGDYSFASGKRPMIFNGIFSYLYSSPYFFLSFTPLYIHLL
jgi:hypothetical protein